MLEEPLEVSSRDGFEVGLAGDTAHHEADVVKAFTLLHQRLYVLITVVRFLTHGAVVVETASVIMECN